MLTFKVVWVDSNTDSWCKNIHVTATKWEFAMLYTVHVEGLGYLHSVSFIHFVLTDALCK